MPQTEYDNLKFLGKVSKAEMWWLLQNSEVVLIYSLMENKPYTALKSFMAETPPAPQAATPRKETLTTSRLAEISLIVDTGGVYTEEG